MLLVESALTGENNKLLACHFFEFVGNMNFLSKKTPLFNLSTGWPSYYMHPLLSVCGIKFVWEQLPELKCSCPNVALAVIEAI